MAETDFRIIYSLFFLLAGCMVGPNYTPPEILQTASWVEEALEEEPSSDWWTCFHDPLLTECIEKARMQNKDVLIAESRILQALALKQVAASSLFPQINLDLNATRTYFSKNGPVFSIGPAESNLPGSGSEDTGIPFAIQAPQTQNLYNLFFNVSWQLDLFGKTRRAVQAAEAAICASIEEKNGILLTVISEVAQNYMELRANQTLASLLEKEISLQTSKKQIIEASFGAGYVNLLDYEEIEASLSEKKAELPQLVASVYQNIYAISILTGSFPEELLEMLLPLKPLPSIPQEIAVGIRSDILRRRPDVRFAEKKLAEATANVGVSVASFFPSLTLLGDLGLQSLSLGNLFTPKSKTWAYGGDLLEPLFQGGELLGNLKASKAARTEAAVFYERVVLQALFEAEKFLSKFQQNLKTDEYLSHTLQKREHILLIKERSFEKGLDNQISLIDTEREVILSQSVLQKSLYQSLESLISLYKALGGGWQQTQ